MTSRYRCKPDNLSSIPEAQGGRWKKRAAKSCWNLQMHSVVCARVHTVTVIESLKCTRPETQSLLYCTFLLNMKVHACAES